MALHGALHVLFRGAGLEIELAIQGVELEEVAMDLARGRARSAIADFVEIIGALSRTVGGLLGLREILRKRTQIRRLVKNHPMHPNSNGSIGIIGDKSKALGG